MAYASSSGSGKGSASPGPSYSGNISAGPASSSNISSAPVYLGNISSAPIYLGNISSAPIYSGNIHSGQGPSIKPVSPGFVPSNYINSNNLSQSTKYGSPIKGDSSDYGVNLNKDMPLGVSNKYTESSLDTKGPKDLVDVLNSLYNSKMKGVSELNKAGNSINITNIFIYNPSDKDLSNNPIFNDFEGVYSPLSSLLSKLNPYGGSNNSLGSGFGDLNLSASGNSNIFSGYFDDPSTLKKKYEELEKMLKLYELQLKSSVNGKSDFDYKTKLDSPSEVYQKSKKSKHDQTIQNSQADLRIFNPSSFVNSKTKMVENSDDIMNYVKSAFKSTTGFNLPEDISINLCSEVELKKAHKIFNGEWSDGIQGFCVNRFKLHNNSQIFVKKDELAKTLLTIGHELGHLQTASLNPIEEEAKAYAFSIEWMNKIKQENIAGLSNVIVCNNPASNGLHNVAFDFVSNLIKQGMSALEIFNGLIENKLGI